MLVQEYLPFIRRSKLAAEHLSPWEERRLLRREVSWQERMAKVGGAEIDRARAQETLKLLQPKLLEAENRVAALNRNLLGWAAIAVAAVVSLLLNGHAILEAIRR